MIILNTQIKRYNIDGNGCQQCFDDIVFESNDTKNVGNDNGYQILFH